MFSRISGTILPHARGFLKTRSFSVARCLAMELKQVVSALESFAPTSLAESWDNVGLLIEPTGKHTVKSLLLTNDLTESVLQEAVEKQVNMIISYHPPIFVPLKRLTSKSFKERIIVKAIEEKIAIYSPHTAFDAVRGGVNDWLASGLGSGTVAPLSNSMEDCIHGCTCNVIATVGRVTEGCKKMIERLTSDITKLDGVGAVSVERSERLDGSRCHKIHVSCSDSSLTHVRDVLKSYDVTNMDVYPVRKAPIPGTGSGRLCTLETPVSLTELISRIKDHLQLAHVRLAKAQAGESPSADPLISTVALCAGSGASVLRGVKADVYLTGEMSHHDVLDAVSHGAHVVLCEHSNTERGFLSVFRSQLQGLLHNEVEVLVSTMDADPLLVV